MVQKQPLNIIRTVYTNARDECFEFVVVAKRVERDVLCDLFTEENT